MPTPPQRQWDGWYFDGRTARRHPVAVHVFSDGLAIILDEGSSRRWAYERIRQTQGTHPGELVRFEYGGDPPEALIVPDPAILTAIREAAPARRGRFRAPARRGVWVAATIGTAIALVLLGWGLYAWGIPALADAVAARLPVAWEEQLGAIVTDELAPAERRCGQPEVHEALERVLGVLTASGPPTAYHYTVIVSADDAPNAFAAPGGYVVVTRGLLRLADRSEEVAGVMAHEAQHIVQRHATRLLVRELSFRALVSLAAGDLRGLGSALSAARSLGQMRYQRADETAADREAVRMLAAARIDPHGMVTLFRKLQQSSAAAFEPPAYLSTHPAIDERIATLERLAAESPVDPVPLLPDYPWAELAQRCS